MGNDNLLKLMKHTAVRAHISPEIFHSLSYRGQIDHVIGAVKEAVELLPFDRNLQRDYRKLREDETFKLYFPERTRNQSRKQKNPGYKSLNGF